MSGKGRGAGRRFWAMQAQVMNSQRIFAAVSAGKRESAGQPALAALLELLLQLFLFPQAATFGACLLQTAAHSAQARLAAEARTSGAKSGPSGVGDAITLWIRALGIDHWQTIR